MLRSFARTFSLLLLAAACGSGVPFGAADSGTVAGPILHLDRNPILLGAAAGTRATGNLQISNVGSGELQITSLSLAFANGSLPRAIDAGGVFDQPIIRGSATRVQLLIDSNAAEQPHLIVPVTGC